jgi:hypothetical protein
MVSTGSDGRVLVEGVLLGRIKAWSLNQTREMRENSLRGLWSRRYKTGKRTASGQLDLYYDSSNTLAADLLNSLREETPVTVTLRLYLSTTRSLEGEARISSHGNEQSIGKVSTQTFSFTFTGPLTQRDL